MARTDDELKQLARDIHGGRVFTDQFHIPKEEWADIVRMVFMPLGLMDTETLDKFVAQKPALLFEYLDKAGPRSINGYPMFFSLQFVAVDEMPRLVEYLKALQSAPDPLATV